MAKIQIPNNPGMPSFKNFPGVENQELIPEKIEEIATILRNSFSKKESQNLPGLAIAILLSGLFLLLLYHIQHPY